MNDVVDFSREYYKNSEYDIHIYKRKGMENSKQIISGTDRLTMVAGVSSFIQSCLDTGLISSFEELDMIIDSVKAARKTGIRNKVVYSNLDKEV